MSDDLDAVISTVRERVRPGGDERERLRTVTEELIERTETAAESLPVDADVLLVGSTARDTWLSGDRDIDVFVRFPPDLERDRLESCGLAVGNEVLPDGREEYAEHPYVHGEFEGFSVDLVPCYRVASATDIRSAVDRTPFHTRYLQERLTDELADEVRLFKQFLTGIGVYGSDLRTRGVSGYLAELLVLAYGGFRDLLEAAADWNPPVRIDPADHGTATFDDPLVVVDPTDPERNVAAVLSAENLARIQHYARAFLDDPREELFVVDSPEPLSADDVRERIADRATTPVAVRFESPDIVADQLYPQLRKSLEGIESMLDRHGFEPLRSATFAEETAVLFVECAVAERPAIERHVGPPVAVREHADSFYESYRDDDAVYGPFVEDDRYVVERRRAYRTPEELLASDALFETSLGVRVQAALEDDYEVLVDEEVVRLAEEFGTDLARYFSPTP